MDAAVLSAEWDPRELSGIADRENNRAGDASECYRSPELSIVERPRPEPGPHEALIRVRFAGICGSDLALQATDEAGYVHYPAYAELPVVLGHEFAGEVTAIGADVDSVVPGDLVTAEVTQHCGRCRACSLGHPGQCANFEQLGFTVDGAFAEYITVPERFVWPVNRLREAYQSKEAALRAAATIEPTTISFEGLYRRANHVDPGGYHVYHGAGPIGLTGMNLSLATGAGTVIGVEPTPDRRALAREIGVPHVFDPSTDELVAAITAATDGALADVHIETSGAVEETYPVIQETLAPNGDIVHISNAATAPRLDLRSLQANAAQVYGSEGHFGAEVYERVIRLMAAGRLDNTPLITATYPLAATPEASKQAARRVDGKVLIAC